MYESDCFVHWIQRSGDTFYFLPIQPNEYNTLILCTRMLIRKEISYSNQSLTFATHSKKKIRRLSVRLRGSNDLHVGRKMATFQLFFQSGRAKGLAAALCYLMNAAELVFESLYVGPPLWSSGQSFWLQIQRSRVRFPALPDFLRSSGSGTGSTQPREVN